MYNSEIVDRFEERGIDIQLLLRRLETDYPTQYNYKVLREAAEVIRFYLEQEHNNG
jgi:hypothetical protein